MIAVEAWSLGTVLGFSHSTELKAYSSVAKSKHALSLSPLMEAYVVSVGLANISHPIPTDIPAVSSLLFSSWLRHAQRAIMPTPPQGNRRLPSNSETTTKHSGSSHGSSEISIKSPMLFWGSLHKHDVTTMTSPYR